MKVMTDREKVIKGLECCRRGFCFSCPYNDGVDENTECKQRWADDALSLLKAQEVPDINAGEWTTERTQEHDGEWYCSECGYEPVVMSDDMKYCPGCGRKMLLPEPPKEGNT